MNFRVRACNKAVAGDYSDPVTLETKGKIAYLKLASCIVLNMGGLIRYELDYKVTIFGQYLCLYLM